MTKPTHGDITGTGNDASIELPIFPLNTVLFPQGVLPLRVFEARYMDMVRDCLKRETNFGVCLITDGGEVGVPAEHTGSGCSARIADWDMEQLGLLNIRTIGEQRFTIERSHIERDGLTVAQVNLIAPEFDSAIPVELEACAALLGRIVRDLVEKETDPVRKMIESPYQFDSASWVSNRLCEFLPIPAETKQHLMLLDDPIARLKAVHETLSRQGIV